MGKADLECSLLEYDLWKAHLLGYPRWSVTPVLQVYIPRIEATSSKEMVVFSVDNG